MINAFLLAFKVLTDNPKDLLIILLPLSSKIIQNYPKNRNRLSLVLFIFTKKQFIYFLFIELVLFFIDFSVMIFLNSIDFFPIEIKSL